MLDMDIEFRRGVLFVRLIGKLSKLTKDKFMNDIIDIIDESGINNIIVNLENIDLIDKEGIDVLNKVKYLVKKNKGDLVICNMKLNLENKFNSNIFYNFKNELVALNTFNI